jgi:acetoin utilization deacetylase AcuC-like enzyme
MKVIYSNNHINHHPPFQFLGNGMHPYPEVPERLGVILNALREAGSVDVVQPGAFSMEAIREVHAAGFLHYLEGVYKAWVADGGGSEAGLIPDTFAMRALRGQPKDLVHQAGYYCFETQTPVMERTFEAAKEAAFCALTGADFLLAGDRSAYSMCRPPGHHAGRDLYGGYCYLNNAAIAATHLSKHGRVAILDVDFHHGNGTQDIFYDSDAVLFVSLHADPNRKYPFFSGFEGEKGEGSGIGYNWNFPLGTGVGEAEYLDVLDLAAEKIDDFDPAFLVISMGADIFRDDPLGDFDLGVDAFGAIGRRLSALGVSTLIVQEGGYDLASLGDCVVTFLAGFAS